MTARGSGIYLYTSHMAIDRASGLPLSIQVHDELLARIRNGVFTPDERLPPEMALAAEFGVNRLTVRRALADLARSGHVIAKHGVGTFVRRPVEMFEFESHSGDWTLESEKAFEATAEAGHVTSEQLLDARLVDTPDEILQYLEADRSLWFETVRRVNDDPTTRCEYWLARDRGLSAAEQSKLEDGVDVRAIRDLAGDDMSVAWRGHDAAAATRRDAGVLEIPVGSPLLVRFGLNTDFDGKPLLYTKRFIRAGTTRMILRYPPPSDPNR